MAVIALWLTYAAAAAAVLWLARRFTVCFSARMGLVLALLPLVFTGQAMLLGRLYGPADLYFTADPWKHLAEGQTPPHNPILSDLAFANLPWRAAVREAIANGRAPLWNRFVLGGTPLLGAAQAGVFHPSTWAGLWLPLPLSWTFSCTFTLLLALVAAFVFFRDFDLTPRAALIGAVGWGVLDVRGVLERVERRTFDGHVSAPSARPSAPRPRRRRQRRGIDHRSAVPLHLRRASGVLLPWRGGGRRLFPVGALGRVASAGSAARRGRRLRRGDAGAAPFGTSALPAPGDDSAFGGVPRPPCGPLRRTESTVGRARGVRPKTSSGPVAVCPRHLWKERGGHTAGRRFRHASRLCGSGPVPARAPGLRRPVARARQNHLRGTPPRGNRVRRQCPGVARLDFPPARVRALAQLPAGFPRRIRPVGPGGPRRGFAARRQGSATSRRRRRGLPRHSRSYVPLGRPDRRRAGDRTRVRAARLSVRSPAGGFACDGGRGRPPPARGCRRRPGVPRAPAFSRDAGNLSDASVRVAGAAPADPRRAAPGGGRAVAAGRAFGRPAPERLRSLRRRGRPRLRIARSRPFRRHVPAVVPGAARLLQSRGRPDAPVPGVPECRLRGRDPAGTGPARLGRTGARSGALDLSRIRGRSHAPSCLERFAAVATPLPGMARVDDFRKAVFLEGETEGEEPNGAATLLVREVGPDLVVELDASSRALVATSLPDWPGWIAESDERPLPRATINHAFVGFWVSPGTHLVRLRYRPVSWGLGLSAFVVGLALSAGWAFSSRFSSA